MRRRRRIRIALLALVALASVGLGLAAYFGPLLPEVDLATVNARFSIRGDQGKPRELVGRGPRAASCATGPVVWRAGRRGGVAGGWRPVARPEPATARTGPSTCH